MITYQKKNSKFINNIPPLIKKLFIENNLKIAIVYKNVHLIKYLLDNNARSERALIMAANTNDIKIVELVLEYFDLRFINEITEEGTALTIAAEKSNLEIVNKLLSIEGIDPSLVNSRYLTALMIAMMNQEDEICKSILDFYGENLKDQTFQLDRAIQMLLTLELRNKSYFCGKKDQDLKINQKMISILKRILEVENVGLNCYGGNHSILSFACKINELSLVEYLLKTNKVDVNLKDPNEGNTALIVSILNDNSDIAKILIEHESIDLNMSNYRKETALTVAVAKENTSIINNIINNKKFEAKQSRLNYAFYISSPKISKLLISTKTLDVNYLYKMNSISISKSIFSNDQFTIYSKSPSSKNKSKDKDPNENDFPFCTKLTDISKNKYNIKNSENNSTIIELIDLIVNHHSFDKEKSLAKIALFNSTSCNCDIEIFKKFLSIFENDVNILDENGLSLLISATKNENKEVVHFLLNDPKFDCNKNEVLYAYVLSTKTPSIKEELSDFIKEHSQSIDFNRLMPNRKAPPTNILDQKD